MNGYQRASEISLRCGIMKIPVTRQAGVSNGHIAPFCGVGVSRKKYIRLGRLFGRFKVVVGRARTNLFRSASRGYQGVSVYGIFKRCVKCGKVLLMLSAFTTGLLTRLLESQTLWIVVA